MSTLFLHIGHGKTGSSWLQSALALSQDRLAAAGIVYPTPPGGLPADPTSISTGNGRHLLESSAAFAEHLPVDTRRPRHLLYSSEYLFLALEQLPSPEHLTELAQSHGLERVEILCFIRNPVGHASSAYQQRVKRAGLHESISRFFEDFRFPERVAALVRKFAPLPGLNLQLRNYDVCKDSLLDILQSWLKLPSGTLIEPPLPRINRSLTHAEITLQKALNRQLGPSGRLLADPLCEHLPLAEPDKVLPPREVQLALCQRMQAAMELTNSSLPAKHHYAWDILEPDPEPPDIAFSEAQIEVIAESLGSEIARLRRTLESHGGRYRPWWKKYLKFSSRT